jgi:hypothetical protein
MRGMRLTFRGTWLAFVTFIGLLAPTAPALAQDFSLVTTLVHPNPRPNNEDRFGSSVALSGGTLFVGAKDEQGANDYSGAVHVFSDADWSEVARLESSVDADIEFGSAIELDGEQALISNTAIDNGVVWFFEKVAGVWTEKLRVQGVVNEAFGYRLALRGDFAFIAASRVGPGNVRVYRRAAGTWSEVQVLTADDGMAEDFFGYSIAFDGQRLAVSAPGNFLGPKRTGVYTFSRVGDSFVQDGKLAGEDPTALWFGAEVAVNGDTLIVNAPPVYQATSAGKALVYERHGDQWDLDSELTVEGEESFPGELAVDGDMAWFGARTNVPRSQNVYAFQRMSSGWQRGQTLNFPDLGESALTSWDVQGASFAIGFWNGLRTESVQVYRRPGHEGSGGGGAPSGRAGADAAGGSGATGANAAGASGDGTATGAAPSSHGGAAANEGASAGQGTNADSSERGGCALGPSRNARAWPLGVLTLAVALARLRDRRRSAPRG